MELPHQQDAEPRKRNHYEVLGVGLSATTEQIRLAYKREALIHHPDKNLDRIEEATIIFREVAEAYSVLSDPMKRKEYDLNSMNSNPFDDFTFARAKELFQEVFGVAFLTKLKEASEIAKELWSKFEKPAACSVPHFTNAALSIACLPWVRDWKEMQCILEWRTDGSKLDLDLSAHMVGEGGLPIGRVDGRLREIAPDIAEQFQECGIKHLGVAEEVSGNRMHMETLHLQIPKLSQQDLFRYVFVRVSVRAGTCFLPNLRHAEFKLMSSDHPILKADLTDSSAFLGGHAVICTMFIHGLDRWYIMSADAPCNDSLLREEVIQKTMATFACEADKRLLSHKQIHERPMLVSGDEQLATQVRVLVASGDYGAAIEAQETLIKMLIEGEDDEHLRFRIAAEFARMDEMWKCIAAGSGTASPGSCV